MFQAEQDLLHRHLGSAHDTGRIEQHQASRQVQDRMPVAGIFRRHLARLGGQQVFRGAKTRFDPTPVPPGLDQARRSERCGPAEQIAALPAGGRDDDHGDHARAQAGGGQPRIAYTW